LASSLRRRPRGSCWKKDCEVWFTWIIFEFADVAKKK
jgi:hypothetical protein